MLYLLDANVLIDANRDYYGINRVPEFWAWLLEQATSGKVSVPIEMYEEATLPKPKTPGLLDIWLNENRDCIVFYESVQQHLVAEVTEKGYASNLTEDEVEKMGKDPFLIAYALVDPLNRVVVTNEQSKSRKERASRHIPDVCDDFDIGWCNTFELIRKLDFRTDWKSSP